MTATLKSKQTSIATVRNNLRTLASFPTILIFHWSLPLSDLPGVKKKFSKIKSHKEVIEEYHFFYTILLDDRRIWIRIHISDQRIRLRIREAQKHMGPTDPDPQHW